MSSNTIVPFPLFNTRTWIELENGYFLLESKKPRYKHYFIYDGHRRSYLLHREDGPAIENDDNGANLWYLNGKCYSEEDYTQMLSLKVFW